MPIKFSPCNPCCFTYIDYSGTCVKIFSVGSGCLCYNGIFIPIDYAGDSTQYPGFAFWSGSIPNPCGPGDIEFFIDGFYHPSDPNYDTNATLSGYLSVNNSKLGQNYLGEIINSGFFSNGGAGHGTGNYIIDGVIDNVGICAGGTGQFLNHFNIVLSNDCKEGFSFVCSGQILYPYLDAILTNNSCEIPRSTIKYPLKYSVEDNYIHYFKNPLAYWDGDYDDNIGVFSLKYFFGIDRYCNIKNSSGMQNNPLDFNDLPGDISSTGFWSTKCDCDATCLNTFISNYIFNKHIVKGNCSFSNQSFFESEICIKPKSCCNENLVPETLYLDIDLDIGANESLFPITLNRVSTSGINIDDGFCHTYEWFGAVTGYLTNPIWNDCCETFSGFYMNFILHCDSTRYNTWKLRGNYGISGFVNCTCHISNTINTSFFSYDDNALFSPFSLNFKRNVGYEDGSICPTCSYYDTNSIYEDIYNANILFNGKITITE